MSDIWETKIGSESLLTDTDGDGIPDGAEVNLQTKSLYDHDNDGRPDILDMDDDGDGIPSVYEGTSDADSDGLANYLDTDSDGDGVPDRDEVVLSLKDVDSDRVDDRFDADIHSGVDANGDGILDQFTFADSNRNQIADFLDKAVRGLTSHRNIAAAKPAKKSPAQKVQNKVAPAISISNHSEARKPIKEVVHSKTIAKKVQMHDDSDGDGLSNAIELALGLNPSKADSDGDGLNDALEVGIDLKSPQDSDRDGAIDALDPDDDNDGILTRKEIQLSKTLKHKLDTDNDGVFNYQDANDDGDSRLTKLEGSSADNDNDGIPDYLDNNDGISKSDPAKVVVLYDKSNALSNAQSGKQTDPALAIVTSQ
ncbi:hypothetical protein DKW60_01140 [Leucothrix pacifica]|uniref:EF-hand domain-containing protein n=2 Tax=Leucothrix pacifica TaxID=1247513 RepID=A0A317CPG6_9GAMM|nr:hypothetical protein DKW60_01140 [Leucothrix pacifica]